MFTYIHTFSSLPFILSSYSLILAYDKPNLLFLITTELLVHKYSLVHYSRNGSRQGSLTGGGMCVSVHYICFPHFFPQSFTFNPVDLERKMLKNIPFTLLSFKCLPSLQYCYAVGQSTKCLAAHCLVLTAFTSRTFSSGYF